MELGGRSPASWTLRLCGTWLPAVAPALAAPSDTLVVAVAERDTEAIAPWREALKPLSTLVVFSTQCGWQSFAQLGGPTFVACKNTSGTLASPTVLVDHVKQTKAQVILVDPNTPSEYGRAFRADTKAKAVELPSSIEKIPGAQGYLALFDNLIQALEETVKN